LAWGAIAGWLGIGGSAKRKLARSISGIPGLEKRETWGTRRRRMLP